MRYFKCAKTTYSHTLLRCSTVSEILTFKIVYLQKVGQGHGVKFFSRKHIDGIYQNLQKNPTYIFALALTISVILFFFSLDLRKCRSRSGGKFCSMTSFDNKWKNLQITPRHFYASSYCFKDIKIFNFYIQKVAKGHGVKFSQ